MKISDPLGGNDWIKQKLLLKHVTSRDPLVFIDLWNDMAHNEIHPSVVIGKCEIFIKNHFNNISFLTFKCLNIFFKA